VAFFGQLNEIFGLGLFVTDVDGRRQMNIV